MKIAQFKSSQCIVLIPLVSVFGRLVARGGRKRGNRQTDTHTLKTKYRNSRCACAPRVYNRVANTIKYVPLEKLVVKRYTD